MSKCPNCKFTSCYDGCIIRTRQRDKLQSELDKVTKKFLEEIIKEIEEERDPEPLVEIAPDGSIKPCEGTSITKTGNAKIAQNAQ